MTTVTVSPESRIQPRGAINAANAHTLQTHIAQTIQSLEAPSLVIDMRFVDFLDSAGLKALVVSLQLAQQRGKRLMLCSVPQSIRMILEITQLDRIFQLVDVLDDTMAADGSANERLS